MGLDGAPSPSCGRRPLEGGELDVGVVKDDVDLNAPVERVALEGREAHVDLLSMCARRFRRRRKSWSLRL